MRGVGDKESLNETLNQMKKNIKKGNARYDMKLLLWQRIMCICLQPTILYISEPQPGRVLSVYIRCEEQNPNFNTFDSLAT